MLILNVNFLLTIVFSAETSDIKMTLTNFKLS